VDADLAKFLARFLTAMSEFVVTGSADNQIRLWRVATGECLKVWEMPTAIKRVQWSEDDSRFLAVTEARMGHQGTIRVFEINRNGDPKQQADEPVLTITCSRSKAYLAGFCSLDRYIVSCHEDGSICQWDAKDGELCNRVEYMHEGQVMDIQFSADRTYFLTASRDKMAKVG
jgi:translation initiation factor 3 subunit I